MKSQPVKTTLRIPADSIRPGMFISRLDVDWSETPFPSQGFVVKSEGIKSQLANYCRWVMVDLNRSDISSSMESLLGVTNGAVNSKNILKKNQNDMTTVKLAVLKRGEANYGPLDDYHEEAAKMRRLWSSTQSALSDFFRRTKTQLEVDTDGLIQVTAQFHEVILSNPNAALWFCHFESLQNPFLTHAWRSAVFAVMFARSLNLEFHKTETLCRALCYSTLGIFLIKDKVAFFKNTQEQQQKYLWEQTLKLVTRRMKDDRGVKTILGALHERHDGSGYPRNLKSGHVPYYARIASLAHYYALLLDPWTVAAPALTSTEASSHLYGLQDKNFHGELILEFIQCMGSYPTGSIVYLTDGGIAAVLEQKDKYRLHPKLVKVTDEEHRVYKKPQILDLNLKKSQLKGSIPRIQKHVDPSELKIDRNRLKLQIARAYKP
ncbi:MAG: DUF3391 domain-containing protein [Pseudomonadota bacterium]